MYSQKSETKIVDTFTIVVIPYLEFENARDIRPLRDETAGGCA